MKRVKFSTNKFNDNTKRKKKRSNHKTGKSSKSSTETSKDKLRTGKGDVKVRSCFICQSKDHMLADCPYNSYRSSSNNGNNDEKSQQKERKTNATTIPDVELPTVKTLVAGPEETKEVNVLFDTGSDTSLIRSELRDLATEVFPTQILFSGVGSQGSCTESGYFDILLGKDYLSVEFGIVDSMPKGIDCILGLDSGLSVVDLDERIAKVRGTAVSFNILKQDQSSLTEITQKYSEVFAVENWSSTSNLPPVSIEVIEGSTPVRCPVIPQTEEDVESFGKRDSGNAEQRYCHED